MKESVCQKQSVCVSKRARGRLRAPTLPTISRPRGRECVRAKERVCERGCLCVYMKESVCQKQSVCVSKRARGRWRPPTLPTISRPPGRPREREGGREREREGERERERERERGGRGRGWRETDRDRECQKRVPEVGPTLPTGDRDGESPLLVEGLWFSV